MKGIVRLLFIILLLNLIPPQVQARERLIPFEKGDKWGYKDGRGNEVIKPRFDFAAPFHEGLAAICLGCKEGKKGEVRFWEGGKCVSIDKKGKIVMDKKKMSSIGSARIEADGTIVLQLRAESPSGAIGDGLLRYLAGHRDYQEILRHLGGLEKGQEKPVPPWPDEE